MSAFEDLFDGIDPEAGKSFDPIPLRPVLDGNIVPPTPRVGRLEDGTYLLYPGAVNGRHGDSGAGKSWITVLIVAQEIALGHHVLIVDYEDNEQTLVTRLKAMGAADEDIERYVVYVRPNEEATPTVINRLADLISSRSITYCAIDSVGEAFGVEGIDENKDSEVGPWMRRVPRALAEAGAAVDLVDHSTKAADNPLHPSGSKRKRAAITGVSYLVQVVKPLVKAKGLEPVEGRLTLTTAKDRHGNSSAVSWRPRSRLRATPMAVCRLGSGNRCRASWQPRSCPWCSPPAKPLRWLRKRTSR